MFDSGSATYYRLNVCVFPGPPIHIWTLISNVMVLGSGAFGLGHESEALMNRISALMQETPGSLLPFPPYEFIVN